jgi:hypothetical protein
VNDRAIFETSSAHYRFACQPNTADEAVAPALVLVGVLALRAAVIFSAQF